MATERAVIPYKELGLRPGDAAIPILEGVSHRLDLPGFRYGVDWFIGSNQGEPRAILDNARYAIFHEKPSVELWRIMKSVAYQTGYGRNYIFHLRGDRQVDETVVADLLQVKKEVLGRAKLTELGLEYGAVSPLSEVSSEVRHVFDLDLVGGSDYPGDDLVFTSSGDPKFYLALKIKRYLKALYGAEYHHEVVSPFSQWALDNRTREPIERIVARRPILVLDGDNGEGNLTFGSDISKAVLERLKQEKAYFGDRSSPRIETISDPKLAGSINTGQNGDELWAYIEEEVIPEIIRRPKMPLVVFSSTAMDGVAGGLLREAIGTDFIGRKEAVENLLLLFEHQQIPIEHILVLGLSSVYVEKISAFAGKILDNALEIDSETQLQIQGFIQMCKTNQMNEMRLYQIIEKLLRRATRDRGGLKSLEGKNVAVILAASEIESFVGNLDKNKVPKLFWNISTGDRGTIAERVAKATTNRIRLVQIGPLEALKQMIVQTTLGL